MIMSKVRAIYYTIVMLGLIGVVGCSQPLLEEIEQASDYTYKIGPGDSVEIFVWGNPELSTSAAVRPDGKITVPLVEELLASGKTPFQLARDIEKVLAVYVKSPQVVVMVSGFKGISDQQIRVIGRIGGGSGGSGYRGGGGLGGGGLGGGGLGQAAWAVLCGSFFSRDRLDVATKSAIFGRLPERGLSGGRGEDRRRHHPSSSGDTWRDIR